MKKKLKKIPRFRSENEERGFWARSDSSEYVDWSKAEKVRFPNLKPSSKVVSIRLPISLLERLKVSAHKKDIPYQSYAKVLLDASLKEEEVSS
jgi:predicted DNA binding CopG/RHH family protein